MSLSSAKSLLAILAFSGSVAQTNDKPSPIRYRSSTVPASRTHNNAASAAKVSERESSRNRTAALANAPTVHGNEDIQAKMIDGVQFGIACFYGAPSRDGERADTPEREDRLTASHATLPMGTRVEVTNLTNGRAIKVIITDRILPEAERIISVSRRAAERLGFVNAGTVRVKLQLVHEGSRM